MLPRNIFCSWTAPCHSAGTALPAAARRCNIRLSADAVLSLPLCLDEVIGSADEGPRSFTQMHSAYSWLATCQLAKARSSACHTAAAWQQIIGCNTLIHLGPGSSAELHLAKVLPDVAHHLACPVGEGCVGAPWPVDSVGL